MQHRFEHLKRQKNKRFHMSRNVPDFNPYESLPQTQKAEPYGAIGQPAFGRPNPRHARLGFFDCFFEAKEFLGKDYWLFWGLTFIGMLIAGVVPLIVAGPIYCGLGYCFLAVERRQQPSFDLMFKGFDEFLNTLIPVLLYSLFMFLVIPIYLISVFSGVALCSTGAAVPFTLGICSILFGLSVQIIGSVLISYGALFACFLVAEYKLEGMDAFKVSLKGIQKNLLGMLGVTFASMIVSFCAMILCYIPLLLMIPIFICAPFICYRKIFRAPPEPTKMGV